MTHSGEARLGSGQLGSDFGQILVRLGGQRTGMGGAFQTKLVGQNGSLI